MFDLLLSQLGIKPDELQQMARSMTQNVAEANARLKRIEEHLGITDPIVLGGPDNG